MASEVSREEYWPCACVRRDKAGNMTHIKLHHPSRKKCRVCKCERPSVWPPMEDRTQIKPKGKKGGRSC